MSRSSRPSPDHAREARVYAWLDVLRFAVTALFETASSGTLIKC